jgi:hypothetical protein
MRDLVGIQRETILIRIRVIILYGREVDDDGVFVPNVSVGMPDAGGNVHETPAILG